MSFAADNRNWEWTIWDTVKRSSPETLGVGDPKILMRFKDAWVHEHRQEIKEAADNYGIPEILLAGVCWIDVGGDADMIKKFESGVRGSEAMREPFLGRLEVSRKAAVAISGPAAQAAGGRMHEASDDPWEGLRPAEQARIVDCLAHEPCNVGVLARQLRRLKQIDFGDAHAPSSMVIELVASRYHLGPQVPRAVVEADMRYGEFILARSDRFTTLLADSDW